MTTMNHTNNAPETKDEVANGTKLKPKVEEEGKDENEARGNWTGKMDFVLSLLGYAVGLGNVWRFPYLCYKNGGGAFLIPYTIALLIIGMPFFYLEMFLGQFTSCGPINCWEFAPIFQGLGVAQLIVSGLVNIYYNVIIGWTIYYLFSTLINITELPWIACNHEWNTPQCMDRLPNVSCNSTGLIRQLNGTCTNGTTTTGLWDVVVYQNVTNLKRTTASEEYYNRKVLELSSGIDDIGVLKWDLSLCLLLAWIICYACMIKGIKTTGKVVYFTALFPYVVLVILFGRGVSLPGAADGLTFFLKPDFSKLSEARVWRDAALQLFFSMGTCWGGTITLSSYNRFHNNFLRDMVVVTLTNWMTGIFAGLVIFSFLGFMAQNMGVSVGDVADSGPGLAFVVYPDAVTRLPISPLWSVLFFIMLLTLGLDSVFAGMESILTAILDSFPNLRNRKPIVVLLLFSIFYLLGLPLCTRGGSYILQLMDNYVSAWSVLVIAFILSVNVTWLYGVNRLYKDLEVVLGKKQSQWWRICLQFLAPAFILFLLVFSLVDYHPATYGAYVYPKWADALGWVMSFASIIWIPIVAVWKVYKEYDANICTRIRNLTIPSTYWGPALPRHRSLIDYIDGFDIDPWNLKSVDVGKDNLSYENEIHVCIDDIRTNWPNNSIYVETSL